MWPFSKVERLQRLKADYLWFDKNWNNLLSAVITLNCSTILLINMTCLIILHTIYPQHVAINFDCVRIFFGRNEQVEYTLKITLENIKRWIFLRAPPFPFKCVVFVPLHKRTIFIDFKYPQQCVFLLRWWREVIWLKLEINAISQFDDILRQAAFQCNACTGRIYLRIKLKNMYF